MLNRILRSASARCTCNGKAQTPKALSDFFAQIEQNKPALVWPSDWPDARRQIIRQTLNLDYLSNDVFYIGFTSGSTGTPKAFYRTHQSWLESFTVLGEIPQTIMTTGDLSHSLHLFAGVLAMHHGRHFICFDSFSASRVNRQLAVVDWLFTTPSQLRALCRNHARFDHVSAVWVSGAALTEADKSLAQACFVNARIGQFYGASETSFIAIADEHTPKGSVGRPADIGVDVRFDHEQRIWVRSKMNFAGYLLPAHSPAGEWVTVDDAGYQDAQGYLYVQGRIQRMINSAGLNIYPEEIEAQLRKHAWVQDVVVLGIASELRGESVAAVIVASEQFNGEISELRQSLKDYLRDQLGKLRVPKQWQFVDTIAYNRSGKPDLEAIHELFCTR